MSLGLVSLITSQDAAVRNRSLDEVCASAPFEQLLAECDALDAFRRESHNLYERVRALFFLYAIHRFHLPARPDLKKGGLCKLVTEELEYGHCATLAWLLTPKQMELMV